jgi:hypothetical protein
MLTSLFPQVGVNPEEITLAHHINPACFMYLKDGSDCVVKVQGMPGVTLWLAAVGIVAKA